MADTSDRNIVSSRLSCADGLPGARYAGVHQLLTDTYSYDRYRVRRTIRDWGEARFIPLDENTFRSALDQFAGAQMRFGK